jgi:hypothetical protein
MGSVRTAFVLRPEVIGGRLVEVDILGGSKREEGRAGDVGH